MKKIIGIIAVICIAAAALTACGGSEKETTAATKENTTTENKTTEQEPTTGIPGYYFKYEKGTVKANIQPNDDAGDILAALGDPLSYSESNSCGFEGLDKTYVYSSFTITTYPDGDIDRINTVSLSDDTVNTVEGICIGDSEDKVKSVYGEDAFNGIAAYVVEDGNCTLTITVEGGSVTKIIYQAIV